jgi:hypothetical protein
MFSIAVKIEGIENRRRNAGLMHVIIGFFLILKGITYYSYYHFQFIVLYPILIVASFSLFYGFFRKRIDTSSSYHTSLRLLQVVTFFVLGIVMTRTGKTMEYTGMFIFSVLCILLYISERLIFRDTILYFEEGGVRIPGYSREHLIQWRDLNNVIVREDFVTLFHVKQKYLQFQVLQNLSMLEVAKMNAFCKEQIERVAEATPTNN